MSLFATDIDEELLTEKIQLEAVIGKINAKIAKEVSKYASNDKFPQFKISIRESEDDDFKHEVYYDNARDVIKLLMEYI